MTYLQLRSSVTCADNRPLLKDYLLCMEWNKAKEGENGR